MRGDALLQYGGVIEAQRSVGSPVVNWYALGCSGLRARLVGGSRVCIRRVSPGCGVHRRKKHGVKCAARLAKCAQSGRVVRLVEDAQSAGALPVCVHAVECGSRWHGCRAKCLQACVASLFHGSQRDRVQRRLVQQCSNHAGSGYGGARVEGRNLEAVQRVLEQEHVYVRVFESSCASLIAGGFVDAVWQLGSMRGECAGALAWLSDARHVVKVHCADSLLEGLDCAAMSVMPAPWTRVIVGAPKK